MALLKSRAGVVGASLYLLIFLCASIYPMLDRRTFSGLFAALLAWPWVDYFPSALLLLGVLLNTAIIYVVLAILTVLPALLRDQLGK
jgi:hypothetical protein